MAGTNECGGLLRPDTIAMSGSRLVAMPQMCVVCGAPPRGFDDQKANAQWTVHTGFKEYTTYSTKEISFRVPYCDNHHRQFRSRYVKWLIVAASALVGAGLFLMLAAPDSEPVPTALAGGIAGASVLTLVVFGLSVPILRAKFGTDRSTWPFLATTGFEWSMTRQDHGIRAGAILCKFTFTNPEYLKAFMDANPWVGSPGGVEQMLRPAGHSRPANGPKTRPKKTDRQVLTNTRSNLEEAVIAGRLSRGEADQILAESKRQRN